MIYYKPLSREEQEQIYYAMMEACDIAYEGDLQRGLDVGPQELNNEKIKVALDLLVDSEFAELYESSEKERILEPQSLNIT